MTMGKLRMPRLGETMESGKIIGFLVQEGESFARGAVIVELETDKTVAELPALGAGKLIKIYVSAGEDVPVGALLADIEMQGESWIVDDEPKSKSPPVELEAIPQTVVAPVEPVREPMEHTRQRATPLARRLAKNSGVELASIVGTGRRGRVEADDVRRSLARPSLSADYPFDDMRPQGASRANVLFIHGFAADSTHFAILAGLLRANQMRSVMIDLEGHGLNPNMASEPMLLGSGLAQFAETVFAGEEFHIVSHSLGIFGALNAARSTFAQSLTAISPAGVGSRIDGEFIATLANPRSAGELTHQMRKLAANGAVPTDSKITEIYMELQRGRLRHLAENVAHGDHVLIDSQSALARLAVKIPVRVIVGLEDKIIDPLAALGISPLIGVHALPRVGHLAYSEAASEVAEILLKTIAKDL